MAHLGKFITINSTQMPNPVSGTFSMGLNPDENVFSNEAGEQMSNVKRLNRISWSGTFNCTSGMRNTLLGYCKVSQVSCTVDGISYTGRLRTGGDITMVEGSELVEGTQGLWVVPLRFEEF